ncbi:MAG: polyphosphate polymerase domain-containing protein [Planctomycetota bacterium]|nr:polyphosphate polymerase domain-containing protein [Planctomycetota bacterium]
MAAREAKLHFSRFEFKYVMPRGLRDDVEAELGHFVELDPYVQGQPNQQYFVRSLYFDDANHTCFREKVDGMHTRSKFRLRTYTRDPAKPAPSFLEVKGRWNNLVFKHRELVQEGYDPGASGYGMSQLIVRHTRASKVRDQFEFDLYRKQIRPVVLVDYERRPYVSRFDPHFRLTFDQRLEAGSTDMLFPGPNVTMRQLVPGYTVMEVKFRHHVPSWFHRIIQAYELRRVSISKICTGTEALGLELDPN